MGDDVLAPLRELLEKYDLLLKLHEEPPKKTLTRRQSLRQLAARFPSALREWEGLGVCELRHRHSCIVALLALRQSDPSAAGAALANGEAWLRYMLDLYGCLRRLLAGHADRPRQPGRRLSELAYQEVAALHGVSVHDVKQALFASAVAQNEKAAV